MKYEVSVRAYALNIQCDWLQCDIKTAKLGETRVQRRVYFFVSTDDGYWLQCDIKTAKLGEIRVQRRVYLFVSTDDGCGCSQNLVYFLGGGRGGSVACMYIHD